MMAVLIAVVKFVMFMQVWIRGFPLSLQEALYFKNYPIVTDCCDAFKEVVIEGDDGFGKIIPVEATNFLKSAIEEVLDNKVDFNKNGIMASNFVSSNFTWSKITGKFDNYFKEIYENR